MPGDSPREPLRVRGVCAAPSPARLQQRAPQSIGRVVELGVGQCLVVVCSLLQVAGRLKHACGLQPQRTAKDRVARIGTARQVPGNGGALALGPLPQNAQYEIFGPALECVLERCLRCALVFGGQCEGLAHAMLRGLQPAV